MEGGGSVGGKRRRGFKSGELAQYASLEGGRQEQSCIQQ